MAAEKQVILRGAGLLADTGMIRDDKVAGEAGIKPGHMLTFEGSGTAEELFTHNVAAGAKVGLYALERDEAGDDLDVAYAIGDNVKYCHHVAGVVLNLWLGAGITGSEGLGVCSNGDGTVKLATGVVPDSVVGYIDGETVVTTNAAKRVAVRLA